MHMIYRILLARIGKFRRLVAVPALLAAMTSVAMAVANYSILPDPDPNRFTEEIAAFAVLDSKNSVPGDALLFIGSSSIRFWESANAFPDYDIINRGFGGSQASDALHFFEELVTPYEPAAIVFYEGDNDIAEGKSAGQVLDDITQFTNRVQSSLPGTCLILISIKPSKTRMMYWDEMVAANKLIRKLAESHSFVTFVDLATPLFDDDNDLRDVFMPDGLHLNESGYAIWNQHLLRHLQQHIDGADCQSG